MAAIKNRAAVVAAGLPRLLGNDTDVFSVVARHEPIARMELLAVFGERGQRITRNHRLGLLCEWTDRSDYYGRGKTPIIVALNRKFPLFAEVRNLLLCLAERHPIPAQSLPRDVKSGDRATSFDLDTLCGKPVKTRVLATVAALGDSVSRSTLEAAVPFESLTAVEGAITALLREGIIRRTPLGLDFAEAEWAPLFRAVMLRYLREKPDIDRAIQDRVKTKNEIRKTFRERSFFGKRAIERVLVLLATEGPQRQSVLKSKAMLTHNSKTLELLLESEVVVKSWAGRHAIIGLNAGYPAYDELRRLVLKVAGRKCYVGADPFLAPVNASHRHVLGTEARAMALLMMNTVPGGEIDGAALLLLKPEHDMNAMAGNLKRLVDEEVVRVRRKATLMLYSLNPEHRYFAELKAFLDAVARSWPDLVTSVPHLRKLEDPIRRHWDHL